MNEFKVFETDKFKSDLEEAAFWLYSHNLEQSESFADKKFIELQNEINDLKNHLKKTPFIGQADELTKIRSFPIYDGRFLANWFINEHARSVIILNLFDSKYPRDLREFKFDE